MKRRRSLIIILSVIILLAAAGAMVMSGTDYDNREKLQPYGAVTVTDRGSMIIFDGPGTEDALIFYPGAMVEHTAYSALLQRIAADGVDCFLMKMPFRMAFTRVNAADSVLRAYPYARYYLGGHSLGGAMACMYADRHPGKLTGLVLLAAYSSKDLSGSGLRVLSVTGTEDGVISRAKQESGRALLPADTVYMEIPGGNHAQFGTYGEQRGDGKALIAPEEQRRLTADAVVSFILGNDTP